MLLKCENINNLFQNKGNTIKGMIRCHLSLIRLEIRMMQVWENRQFHIFLMEI